MAKPASKERIEHILEAIGLIRTFVEGLNEHEFAANLQVQSAVQFQFAVIGEAVNHIDRDILNKYPYPWHIPRAFRNFIIHAYHGIKPERIYYATRDLEPLEGVLKQMLEAEFDSSESRY
jgi:uncharacterized protein with HEPN domain